MQADGLLPTSIRSSGRNAYPHQVGLSTRARVFALSGILSSPTALAELGKFAPAFKGPRRLTVAAASLWDEEDARRGPRFDKLFQKHAVGFNALFLELAAPLIDPSRARMDPWPLRKKKVRLPMCVNFCHLSFATFSQIENMQIELSNFYMSNRY